MPVIRNKNKDISRRVTERFYQSTDRLVELGILKSCNELCVLAGYNRSNFYAIRKNHARLIPVDLLSYLVMNYPIDGTWLLSGKGEMIRKGRKL